jgi:hypothetical protein
MHNHATPNYNNLQTNTTTDIFGEFVKSQTEFQWHFFGCWINKPLIFIFVVAFFFLYVDFIQCDRRFFFQFNCNFLLISDEKLIFSSIPFHKVLHNLPIKERYIPKQA